MAQILSITPDLIPQSGVFLYPLCITSEEWKTILRALDRGYYMDALGVDVIAAFLNAQMFVNDPLGCPCANAKGSDELPKVRENDGFLEWFNGERWVKLSDLYSDKGNCEECDECEETMGCCVTDIRIKDGVLQYLSCGKWVNVGTFSTADTGEIIEDSPTNSLNDHQPEGTADNVKDNPAPVENFPAERNQNACSKAAYVSDTLDQWASAIADSMASAISQLDWARYMGQYYPHLDRQVNVAKWSVYYFAHGNYEPESFTIVDFDDFQDGWTYFLDNKADVKAYLQCYALDYMSKSSTVTDGDMDFLQRKFEPTTPNAQLNNNLKNFFNVLNRSDIMANGNAYIAKSKGDCSPCRQGSYDPPVQQFDTGIDVFQYASTQTTSNYEGNQIQNWQSDSHYAEFSTLNNNGTQRRLTRTIYLNSKGLGVSTEDIKLWIRVTSHSGGEPDPNANGDYAIEVQAYYGGSYDTGLFTVFGKSPRGNVTYDNVEHEFRLNVRDNLASGVVEFDRIEVSIWSWLNGNSYTVDFDKLYIFADVS